MPTVSFFHPSIFPVKDDSEGEKKKERRGEILIS